MSKEMSDKSNRSDDATEPIRVAVIGAGAAGLSACHRLLQHAGRFSVVIYEQTDAVGGTWVYSETTGKDKYGQPIHSSMYDNLRTNLPKELMAFLDYPFPSGGSSYQGRQDVLQYLKDYTDAFDIRKHIQFLTRVVNVAPLDGNHRNNNWEVEVEQLANRERSKSRFHAVLLCTGHYAVPRYPEFEGAGLSSFKGTVMHSHDYRVPDSFAGTTVMCVGAGSSGVDIALDLATVAKQVYLSHDLPERFVSPFPDNVQQSEWVTDCEADGFRLKDGSRVAADALVVCTGYEYYFPFVDPSCQLEVTEHRVSPLYKHLFLISRPTLSVLSVPFTTVPFVVSDCQAMLVAATLLDPTLLPSGDEMTADTERERQRRLAEGQLPRHFHKFVYRIWPYLDELMELGRLPPVPPARGKLHRLCFDNRSLNFVTFRDLNYTMSDTEALYR